MVSVKHMSDGSVSFLGNWSANLITGRLMLAARTFLPGVSTAGASRRLGNHDGLLLGVVLVKRCGGFVSSLCGSKGIMLSAER